jgi:PAS domain S-box-containing protein
MADMLGYALEETPGQLVDYFMFEEDREDYASRIDARQRGLSEVFERRFRRKDKTTLWCIVSASPLFDGQGRFTGSFAMFTDITDRKQAEKNIQESRALLNSIIEGTTDAIYAKDLQGRYTLCNAAAGRAVGKSPVDVLGKDDYTLFPPSEAHTIMAGDRKVIEGRTVRTHEAVLTIATGQKVTYLSTKGPLFDVSGKPIGLFGLTRDITERKKAEQRLQESEKESRRLAQETNLLAEIGLIISSTLNIDEVYERFAEEVRKLISIDRLTVNIVNPRDKTATTAYISGTELLHRKKGAIYPLAFTFTEEVRRTRTSLLINEENYKDYLERFPGLAIGLHAGFRSLMMIPLISKDEVVAVLQFRSTKLNSYSEKDLKLAERVGAQIAGAIANAQLYLERKRAEEKLKDTLDSLRKALNTTIQVMVSSVEVRDPYTAGHQIRSADLARAIATEMGLPPERIEGLRMAGSIHDIGKLSIPAEILSKPTKLSDIEFLLIKEHARRGFEMLKNVESPWPLAEIVYQHHERMDGSGYPRNLKGEEILIEARILAVADVTEAMASHRPYRPGLGIDATLNEIEKHRGIFYDTAVADACLRLFREKGFKLEGI